MPSSRVFNLLVCSAVLLGSTAGAFAVGSTVSTVGSHTQVASDTAATVDLSSPGAAADPSAAAPSKAAKVPSGTVAPSKKKKSPAAGAGSGATKGPAAGTSGGGSAAAGSGKASSGNASSTGGAAGGGSAGSAAGGASAGSSVRPGGNGKVFIGATAGGHQLAAARTGVGLANHAYGFFSNKVPQAEMITVRAKNTKWREVANAKSGSALHGQIAGWAREIKARGGSVMVAYSHEPEAHDRHTLGNATEYIAAWRRVKAIFDQQGATNVVWAWQMTAYSFKTKPSSEQHAAKWYPGDDVVDIVAADGYNWGSCGGHSGVVSSMASFTDPVLAFGKAHGKRVVLAEFGSIAGPGRAAWLKDAHRYLVANRDMIVAAFYFNLHRTGEPCNWTLTTESEYAALRAMAKDDVNFRV